ERVPAHGRLRGLRLAVISPHLRRNVRERRLGAPDRAARAGGGTPRARDGRGGHGRRTRVSPRRRRIFLVVGILAGVSLAGTLALRAFQENVMFFFDPSQVVAGQVPEGERFRLGGMVSQGSVRRTPGSLEV